MSWSLFAVLLSAIAIPRSWRLAITYARDPSRGLSFNHHQLEALPEVMANRYTAMAAMVTAATLYRDLNVIAFVAGCVAMMAFWDHRIYARRGQHSRRHLVSGSVALIIAAVAVFAKLMNEGAA